MSELSTVVEELYDSIDFTHIGCDDKTGRLSSSGSGIPFTISNAGDLCGEGATIYPGKDGLYNFSEAHNYVYLAYQQACGAQPAGECNNTDIELMWNRWQARQIGSDRYSYSYRYRCRYRYRYRCIEWSRPYNPNLTLALALS